jgi:hypothetical protein
MFVLKVKMSRSVSVRVCDIAKIEVYIRPIKHINGVYIWYQLFFSWVYKSLALKIVLRSL